MAETGNEDPWTGGRRPQEAGRPEDGEGKPPRWERQALERLASAALQEQRRSRRWGIFFKSLVFIYLFLLLYLAFPGDGEKAISAGPHTAVVEIRGVIADATEADADRIIKGLRRAFDNGDTEGVVLRINSPGGSPVQAGLIYDEVRRLREQHPQTPVYAVVEDICASGGYYIAAAADAVYANRSSIVGSIGVLMNGFGFVDAMEKLGVERRLLTSGEHKALLDPFSPTDDQAVDHVQGMLDNIHTQFIQAVKAGRGDRLKDDPELFSGLIWTGERGKELGLVDGLGDVRYVAREVVGAETLRDFTPRTDYLERFARRFGSASGEALAEFFGGMAVR